MPPGKQMRYNLVHCAASDKLQLSVEMEPDDMNLFPVCYEKPVLTSIVGAAENGWQAVCQGGGAPSSGAINCLTGPSVGVAPICPGNGSANNSNRLFNGGSSQERLINPGDVSSGL